jgi:hypothetical protein
MHHGFDYLKLLDAWITNKSDLIVDANNHNLNVIF